METEVVCGRKVPGSCGFRVNDRYFSAKPRFSRHVCPNCGGPLAVVRRGTDDVISGASVSEETGRIELPATT